MCGGIGASMTPRTAADSPMGAAGEVMPWANETMAHTWPDWAASACKRACRPGLATKHPRSHTSAAKTAASSDCRHTEKRRLISGALMECAGDTNTANPSSCQRGRRFRVRACGRAGACRQAKNQVQASGSPTIQGEPAYLDHRFEHVDGDNHRPAVMQAGADHHSLFPARAGQSLADSNAAAFQKCRRRFLGSLKDASPTSC